MMNRARHSADAPKNPPVHLIQVLVVNALCHAVGNGFIRKSASSCSDPM